MDTSEIQKRVDAMPAAMAEKGLKKQRPNSPSPAMNASKACSSGTSGRVAIVRSSTTTTATRPEDVLASMEAWIAALPTRDEANLRSFMTALGEVIEIGRTNGIEVAFVNPLVETMKRLSENAITHQVAAE